MKIAIIGTGKVGSVLALLLVNNPKIDEFLLVNRTRKNAEGLKMDLMGTYPKTGYTVKVGEYKDSSDADIIFITCGVFGTPEGVSLFDVNSKIVEEVMEGWKPKKDAKIVITITPVDETALVAMKLSGLKPNKVIGFGGQLDVNRLEYLIRNDIGDFSKDVKRHFIGVHGASGIPVFSEEVSNKTLMLEDSRNYFKKYLSGLKISTLGTSSELAKLADVLMDDEGKVVDISYYNEDHELFITWPCLVNKTGVVKPANPNLTVAERKEFEELIRKRGG